MMVIIRAAGLSGEYDALAESPWRLNDRMLSFFLALRDYGLPADTRP